MIISQDLSQDHDVVGSFFFFFCRGGGGGVDFCFVFCVTSFRFFRCFFVVCFY